MLLTFVSSESAILGSGNGGTVRGKRTRRLPQPNSTWLGSEEGQSTTSFFLTTAMTAGLDTFAAPSALHLNFPPAASGVFHSRSIACVKVHPVCIYFADA